MRLFLSLSAAVILGVLLLAGCNSQDKVGGSNSAATKPGANATTPATNPPLPPQAQASNTPGDGVRRITAAELNEALGKGEAQVVDVRNDAAFKQSHIKGSILIPFNEVSSHLKELKRDKLIVTYCS